MRQRYSSKHTCRKQVPALIRALLRAGVWQSGDINADIGGGMWDLATEAMAKQGVTNVVYDRFNRTAEENERALDQVFLEVQTATLANTLNVIAEAEVRDLLIGLSAQAPVAYFHVYEGDGSGAGRPTSCGWQENRKLASYISEIEPHFERVALCWVGGLRVIRAERPVYVDRYVGSQSTVPSNHHASSSVRAVTA